ncbi:MAG: tRNA (adenosine(37)-N6)-threonylcarbamoyltransferase complex dimerization subunit type 1 TsaB [Pseudohongiellaceae bacterium]
MPKLLALDSSTYTTKVSLWIDGQLTHYQTEKPRQAAQQLLPLVQRALDEAALTISQLDAIATATGPGSFTGLRIGIGAAQGLSMANNTPLIGISSLELLAYSARNKLSADYFLVCLPAREQEVYFAAYNRNKDTVVLQDRERVLGLNTGNKNLPTFTLEERIGVGAGWQHREQLETLLDIRLKDCIEGLEVTMDDLCGSALQKLEKGEILVAEDLLPNYVKEQLDYHS